MISPKPPAILRTRVVPRGNSCAFRSGDYRCALDITRVIESWHLTRGVWMPQLRVCHLHAIECLTGEKVFMPTFAQQRVTMLELGA